MFSLIHIQFEIEYQNIVLIVSIALEEHISAARTCRKALGTKNPAVLQHAGAM
jgi:hypothetical protein